MAETIRALFSTDRPIDRAIEKVIDYYAQAEGRLAAEIEEYEVTDNVEASFRKFLETYDEGVRAGRVTEIGIWVSGFYGSGKSSFTKYLGFALDSKRKVQGKPFLDLLCDRFRTNAIPALLRTVAKKHPTAIVLLDLGAEQLAESAAVPVSTVLYWKVLQWAGFSKEKKLARLEFTLQQQGKLETFHQAYKAKYNDEWDRIHNDPLLGVAPAQQHIDAFACERHGNAASQPARGGQNQRPLTFDAEVHFCSPCCQTCVDLSPSLAGPKRDVSQTAQHSKALACALDVRT